MQLYGDRKIPADIPEQIVEQVKMQVRISADMQMQTCISAYNPKEVFRYIANGAHTCLSNYMILPIC
ncbi:hypothetical protein, partial [Sphingobacterium sp. UBA2096]|uniref:hypothetical protein n=1 Tax=Sphingobacterium sp. UBA2096 TaxID=1947488 RepID=UPI00257B2B34